LRKARELEGHGSTYRYAHKAQSLELSQTGPLTTRFKFGNLGTAGIKTITFIVQSPAAMEEPLMSRTLKDKNPIYRTDDKHGFEKRVEPIFKRRFLNFKKSGPPVDGEVCPECRGLTDFQSGYLTCCDCGWTEDVLEMFEIERLAA